MLHDVPMESVRYLFDNRLVRPSFWEIQLFERMPRGLQTSIQRTDIVLLRQHVFTHAPPPISILLVSYCNQLLPKLARSLGLCDSNLRQMCVGKDELAICVEM